jgi:hypothetical protein
VTARNDAFMPGESPPLVMMPMHLGAMGYLRRSWSGANDSSSIASWARAIKRAGLGEQVIESD